MVDLKPFWRYYGGKWRASPRYPAPKHGTIVEPFAGCAGYATRHADLDVVLIEKYDRIAEIWDYLIRVPSSEVRRIPYVEAVDDLPSWVPGPARDLVGFWMNSAIASPRKVLSSGRRKLAAMGRKFEGWTEATRERIATQVAHIRHWRVIHGDYRSAPSVAATWFIDPPYQGRAGRHYVHSDVDYEALAEWCRERSGQVIVCEADGATWLPFRPFGAVKAGPARRVSHEVVWTHG